MVKRKWEKLFKILKELKTGKRHKKMNFTMLIPTYNRTDFLDGLLNYVNDSTDVKNIIIADSSSYEHKEGNQQIIKKYKKLNIRYLEYSKYISMFHKIGDAVQYSTTKYTALCGDDDFLINDGIWMATEFLDKNKDYVCAIGSIYSFDGKKLFPSPSNMPIDESDIIERVGNHIYNFTNVQVIFYATYRTDVIKFIFDETKVCTGRYDYDTIPEIVTAILTSILGKTKQLNVHYSYRRYLTDSASSDCKRIPFLVAKGLYKDKHESFRNMLAYHLCMRCNYSFKGCCNLIDDKWKNYIKKYKGFYKEKISNIIH